MIELAFLRVGDIPMEVLARTPLTVEERVRLDAFVFEKNKREFVATRALVAAVLRRWTDAPLVFVRNAHGKPRLASVSDVHFNLTNTVDLVACAVAKAPIGIDAEPLDRAGDILEISQTVFTAEERRGLGPRDAVQLWTRKEAYMKALGVGLSLPPLSFAVDALEGYAFITREIEGHLVSVCIAAGPERQAALEPLVVREVTLS